MKTKSKKSRKSSFEIIIVLIIGLCMIFLINFTTYKVDELINASNEGLLINHTVDDEELLQENFSENILNFRPNACKMIEAFGSDFNLIFRIQFTDDIDPETLPPLTDNSELMELFRSHEDGHTTITIDDVEEDIYFKWIDTTFGEHSLIIMYMYRPIVNHLWVLPITCYIILILVCILLVRLMLARNRDRINEYYKSSQWVQEKVNKQ